MAAPLEIIVGTYEELLVGYKLTQNDSKYSLEQSFTNHSHCGSIRSIACSSKFLASGSTDETIKIFNLIKRVEVGTLMQQEGSINTLEFYDDTFLFSGSEDSTICIYNTSRWECAKMLHGHEKGITSFSIHPSGKLAMSLSKDCKLRTWNLVKGRSAYITNLKTVGEIVRWSPEGGYYVVAKCSTVDVYDVQTAAVVNSFDFGKQVLAVEFIDETHIAIGGEGGNVEIYTHDKGAIATVFKAHDNRIKSIKCIKYGEHLWLITASSDGFIKVWEFKDDNLSEEPCIITKVDTKCRITCMAVACQKEESIEKCSPTIEPEDHIAKIIEEESTENSDSIEEKPKKKKIHFQKEATKRKKKKLT